MPLALGGDRVCRERYTEIQLEVIAVPQAVDADVELFRILASREDAAAGHRRRSMRHFHGSLSFDCAVGADRKAETRIGGIVVNVALRMRLKGSLPALWQPVSLVDDIGEPVGQILIDRAALIRVAHQGCFSARHTIIGLMPETVLVVIVVAQPDQMPDLVRPGTDGHIGLVKRAVDHLYVSGVAVVVGPSSLLIL